jgi:flagellar biosynthetic protein FliP
MTRLVLAALAVVCLVVPALGQQVYGPSPATPMLVTPADAAGVLARSADPTTVNPVRMLSEASNLIPGNRGTDDPTGLSAGLNIMLLLTVIALAPSIMLMTTCFVRVLVVLSLLRQAMGTHSLPPPQIVVAMALFVTLLVMAPTIDRIMDEAIGPYQQGQITDPDELWNKAKQPLRDFMFEQIEATGNWSGVYMLLEYRGVDTSEPERLTRADVDMITLVPSYMLSELKTAFLMGFRVYLPFLVIDMVIASLLISMSMMMLPPVLISLPFKVLLFVLVDGWALVVGSLMTSFVQPESVAVSMGGLLGGGVVGGVSWIGRCIGFG